MTAQELKNSILQLAIQGKLVKQDPNDEPASVLLEKIKEEREKLIKEKKIKREKYSEIYKDPSDNHYYEKFDDGTINDITEEIPFDIPDSWNWIRICNCADVYTGNSISETIKNTKYTGLKEGYNYIGTKDVNFDNTINYKNGVKIPFNENKFRNAYKNNTLICVEGGSAGRKVAKLSEDVCFGNKLATINSWIVNSEYIYLVFQSSIIQNFFKSNMTGIIGGVSINKLKTFLIPIPPLKEQGRIVTKYKLFIPLISNYNNEYCKIEKLNTNYKEELKKSILQYAIQGKLIKQDTNDEPAEVLINKILDEKRELIKTKQIKKENLSVIHKDSTDNQFYEKFDDGKIVNITDEIPFEIPENWCWIRFKNICKVITCGYASTPKYETTGIPFISAKNIKPYKFMPEDHKFISEELYRKLTVNFKPEINDILLTRVGSGIGEAAIINQDFNFAIYVSLTLIKLVNYDFIYNRYILNYILSPFGVRTSLSNIYGKGASQGNLNVNNVRDFLVPIPPLNEQKKIVNIIERLFNIL